LVEIVTEILITSGTDQVRGLERSAQSFLDNVFWLKSGGTPSAYRMKQTIPGHSELIGELEISYDNQCYASREFLSSFRFVIATYWNKSMKDLSSQGREKK